MRALFAHCLKKIAGEFREISEGVSISRGLVRQPIAEHVEGIYLMPLRERTDVVLPFQHRTADAGQQEDGRAAFSRLPIARANVAEANVAILVLLLHRPALPLRTGGYPPSA